MHPYRAFLRTADAAEKLRVAGIQGLLQIPVPFGGLTDLLGEPGRQRGGGVPLMARALGAGLAGPAASRRRDVESNAHIIRAHVAPTSTRFMAISFWLHASFTMWRQRHYLPSAARMRARWW
jgi:hypothetical protein